MKREPWKFPDGRYAWCHCDVITPDVLPWDLFDSLTGGELIVRLVRAYPTRQEAIAALKNAKKRAADAERVAAELKKRAEGIAAQVASLEDAKKVSQETMAFTVDV